MSASETQQKLPDPAGARGYASLLRDPVGARQRAKRCHRDATVAPDQSGRVRDGFEVGTVDVPASDAAQSSAIVVEARAQQALSNFRQSVKVKKDQPLVVNGDVPVVVEIDAVVRKIPGRHPDTDFLRDDEVRVSAWPLLEVLLVAPSAVDRTIVARCQTLLPPALQACQSLFVARAREKSDVEFAVAVVRPLSTRPMAMNEDRACGELGKQWSRVGEEEQIRIDVYDAAGARLLREHVQEKRGRAGVIERQRTSVVAVGLEIGVGLQQLAERERPERRQIQATEDLICLIIKAQRPQLKRWPMLSYGIEKRQPPREVVDVEVSTELQHR